HLPCEFDHRNIVLSNGKARTMCCVCVRVSVCHASITKIHRQLSGCAPSFF
uniref:Uncharacterized protein n=1 Tax=Parascaris univalens TaxID=6257 RepID=A0A915A9F0_PARUN